jgi:hypothetical protein
VGIRVAALLKWAIDGSFRLERRNFTSISSLESVRFGGESRLFYLAYRFDLILYVRCMFFLISYIAAARYRCESSMIEGARFT